MERKVILEKVGEITNGGVFDCIGHDKNYAPVVYFKRRMDAEDKERVLDALMCYFDKYTPHLVRVSHFLDEAAVAAASEKIHDVARKEAEEFYNTIHTDLGGYKFAWLPKVKRD